MTWTRPLIGILDHATYSNVAEMHNRFYRATLRPWLTLIADTLNAQLIGPEPRWREERLFLAFDLSEVLRSDTPEEIAAVVTAINGSVMSPNEGRNRLRMRRATILPPTSSTCRQQHAPLGSPAAERGPAAAACRAGRDDPVKANLRRAMERAAIKMGAGQEPWDRDRFVRELYQDAPDAPAEPLADLVKGLIDLATVTRPRVGALRRRVSGSRTPFPWKYRNPHGRTPHGAQASPSRISRPSPARTRTGRSRRSSPCSATSTTAVTASSAARSSGASPNGTRRAVRSLFCGRMTANRCRSASSRRHRRASTA
jgi:hypothetical protein